MMKLVPMKALELVASRRPIRNSLLYVTSEWAVVHSEVGTSDASDRDDDDMASSVLTLLGRLD